ncbi:hypothetical protein [Flavobacterium sp.]|uniref:hypothetical protein n=1 Tax=Flavobacterium sp. TaxID=239 RepID=UPI002C4B396F|nr:hypothetical protein [Flavobacterium sp.]HSD06672.1 hypothetical protein [Flavobacterium sp.]
MIKAFLTLFLLAAIALSLQLHIANAEHHSENLTTLTTPITIVVLLLLIYFFSPQKTQYRKIIRVFLIICSILSALFFTAFWYVVQLAKAFAH